MKQFFKYMLASFLALILSFFILLFIIVGISLSFDKPVELKDNSVLVLNLNTTINDRVYTSPVDALFEALEDQGPETKGLNEILKAIDAAKQDERIKGIYLDFGLGFMNAGFASCEEIRNALTDFKESGKFIVSYAENYTQKIYSIASVSDEIHLYPAGIFELKGLAVRQAFISGMMEKMEIEPQIIRHGKFKSAIEPLARENMSDENREQIQTFINSIWNSIKLNWATNRGISPGKIDELADQLSIRSAKDAIEQKFVTHLSSRNDVETLILSKIGANSEDELPLISESTYCNLLEEEQKKFKKDKIAILYASGDIEDGYGDDESVSSEKFTKAIQQLRNDDRVKAIVLRVNSPGGSALASDIIFKELELTKQKKPIVVSFGDVAASGGYYIACLGDSIFASSTTITGSIGVFFVSFNIEKLMKNKLGISFDEVNTNKHASFGSMTRPLNETEKTLIHKSIETTYDTFLVRVASGRPLSIPEVDSIAQGRVWSGNDAVSNRLADKIGGLNDALDCAARLAKTDNYKVVEYPKFKHDLEHLFGSMENTLFRSKHLDYLKPYLDQVEQIVSGDPFQLRSPYTIEIY